MDFSKVKDFFKKDTIDKILDFCKKNIRYISAGALLIILILVLTMCTGDKKNAGESVNGETEATGQVADTEDTNEFEVDAIPAVNELINNYYTAYANGDIETLTTLATPISENEQGYISVFSQYVESYQNISCYTKKGLDDNSYLVSVYMEVKFTGVDTLAPGLDFFYVRANEDGSYYIDNLYSQYNLANQENALDADIQNLISQFEQEEDVVALQQDVQAKYESALASDENLSTMVTSTIQDAIAAWVSSVTTPATEETEQPTEETPAEETPAEETPTEETPAEETPAEETPAEETTSETVMVTTNVNVRAAADETSEKIGTADGGATYTRTGTEGDWSIIDYNGTTGYIKSEYLTTDLSTNTTDDSTTTSASVAEGTVITLQSTTNIRSSMSETSDKVGVAFAGEKVTVVMSYAEGWTKVTWDGKEGYIKTELLQ